MKKYQITRKECQKVINSHNRVCQYCGRRLVPLKTVDNVGSPTYWSGCYHGKDWGHFTNGVDLDIFKLAEKAVCNGKIAYRFSEKKDYSKNAEDRLYWFRLQVAGVCSNLETIEYLKKHKPRQTKREFLMKKNF